MDKIKRLFNMEALDWLRGSMKGKWGAYAVILAINVVLSGSGAAQAIVSKGVIDHAVNTSFGQSALFLAVFAGILALQLALSALASLRSVRLKEALNNQLQQDFMTKLYRTEWSTAGKYHSGDLLTHLTSDVYSISEGLVVILPNIVALIVQFGAAFITLMYYDSTLALLAFLLGPVSVVASWFIGRRLKLLQHRIQSAEGQYRSVLHESVQNLTIVKTFEYEESSLKQIRHFQQNRLFWILKRNRFNVAADLTMGVGYRLGFFLAFLWGAYRISTGAASFGMFTAFLQLVGQIQGPLEGLARMFPVLVALMTSSERLLAFQRLEREARQPHPPLPGSGMAGLRIRNVAYSYEPGKPVLADVSVSIRPGELIALIGTSGEGKTTLLRVLLALLKPDHGSVVLENSDGRSAPLSADTRAFFSYVPQGNTLFSGTIADNLRVGYPDATEADMSAALEAACAKGFVDKLPAGMHTVIGEHGAGLSEGQAQRIAIARALIRPAPILLLDEATSALDMDTEWAVLQNIRSFRPARTCIAITHRLSVFDVCDHIYRLSDGRLEEYRNPAAVAGQ